MTIGDMIKEFKRPFMPEDVKYKIQAIGNKACLCVAYVDARLVQERLNAVTDGMWSNTNREIFGPSGESGKMELLAVEATITVFYRENEFEMEYSHSDVGSLDNVNENAHGLKAVYSDAFKRAAVHFGIAQSLYTLPTMFLNKMDENEIRMRNGKPVGIEKGGEKKLEAIYLKEVERLERQFGPAYV